jgi:hypothetical protein
MTTASPSIHARTPGTASSAGVRSAERVARVLLWACAAAAGLAAVSTLPVALSAGPATRFVEVWRVVGFATFAGIFSVIAAAPRRVPPGIWLAVIANKLALTVVALAWSGEAVGAASALWWDGSLTAALVAALVLIRRSR